MKQLSHAQQALSDKNDGGTTLDQDLRDLLREHGEDCPFPTSSSTLTPEALGSLEHSRDTRASLHDGLVGDFTLIATSADVAFATHKSPLTEKDE